MTCTYNLALDCSPNPALVCFTHSPLAPPPPGPPSFVGPAIAPVAPLALQQLASMLVDVCANPRNPGFNHYLFESVAALIKQGCAAQPAMVETFEQMLFPAFNLVLQKVGACVRGVSVCLCLCERERGGGSGREAGRCVCLGGGLHVPCLTTLPALPRPPGQQDVQEFHPYVFQIFSQLIELRSGPGPLPAIYLQIFPPLLMPIFWERSGNVPALVRLLQVCHTRYCRHTHMPHTLPLTALPHTRTLLPPPLQAYRNKVPQTHTHTHGPPPSHCPTRPPPLSRTHPPPLSPSRAPPPSHAHTRPTTHTPGVPEQGP